LLSKNKTQISDFSLEIAQNELEFTKEKGRFQSENQEKLDFLIFSHEKVSFF